MITRRGFVRFAWWVGTITANLVSAALVCVPAARYLRGSAGGSSRDDTWVDLGEAGRFSGDGVHAVTFEMRRVSGYAQTTYQQLAMVTREGEELVVFSPSCPHLGCTVRWNAGGEAFECPCHGGRFDRSGAVTGGPPKRDLDRFRSEVRDGRLMISPGTD